MKSKKILYTITGIFIFLTLVSCNLDNTNDKTSVATLLSYFPLNKSLYYNYRGEGNEYASFTRKIMHVDPPYLQIHDNNGGTIMASVYKVTENQVSRILRQGEYYGNESLINDAQRKVDSEEIIVKTPIQKGISWETNNNRREIVSTKETVIVPAGTFYDVIKIKIESIDNNYTGYEYFAPNVGLIKQEHIGEGYQIKSELKSYGVIGENVDIIKQENIVLRAYYAEHLVRSIFRTAYESYINVDRLSNNSSDDFQLIMANLEESLALVATPEIVQEQINKLRQIYLGGEGELNFPTHEVIKNINIIEQDDTHVTVEFTVQMYYPTREWSGEAYDKNITYIVELILVQGKWKVNSIIFR